MSNVVTLPVTLIERYGDAPADDAKARFLRHRKRLGLNEPLRSDDDDGLVLRADPGRL